MKFSESSQFLSFFYDFQLEDSETYHSTNGWSSSSAIPPEMFWISPVKNRHSFLRRSIFYCASAQLFGKLLAL